VQVRLVSNRHFAEPQCTATELRSLHRELLLMRCLHVHSKLTTRAHASSLHEIRVLSYQFTLTSTHCDICCETVFVSDAAVCCAAAAVQVKYSDVTGRFEVEVDKKPRSYNDLSNLIADQICLQRLYPNMPKAEALERLQSATTAATATAAAAV
jgi:hypothetical protein